MLLYERPLVVAFLVEFFHLVFLSARLSIELLAFQITFNCFVLPNKMVKGGSVFPAEGAKTLPGVTTRNSSIGSRLIVGYHIGQ